MHDPIDHLAELFEKFPGIGARQAQRFVHYLLKSSPALRREIAESIEQLSGTVHQCPACQRFFAGASKACTICSNTSRDTHLLALVASDADMAALERSQTFHGHYFVLGGTISLAHEKASHLRIPQLLAFLPGRIKMGLTEIILALPANPEGDATGLRVRDELDTLIHEHGLTVTSLGRGLSTGSELEYADPDTLKSALESRR